jgi:AcrR family transcriptional regulator
MPDPTPPTNRRERLRREMIAEIKALARQQMTLAGPGAVSLNAIARQLGVSPAAIYRYFDGIGALLTELTLEGLSVLENKIKSALVIVAPLGLRAELRAIGLTYWQWAIENQADFMLMNAYPVPGYEPPEEVIEPAVQKVFVLFLDVLQRAHQAGKLNIPDISHLANQPHWESYQKYDQLWREKYGVAVPLAVYHYGFAGLSLFNGLVLLHMQQRFAPAFPDGVEIELSAFLDRIGL